MPEWMIGLLETQQLTLPLWLPVAALGLTVVLLIWVTALLLSARRRKNAERIADFSDPITSIHVGKLHDQGAREYQQDSFGVSDEKTYSATGLLAVVADGMGGLADGDRVSAALVETALDGFMYSQGQGTPEQVLLTLTQWGVQEVNRLLGPENYRKSGSTLVMGLIRGDLFSWISVGDSRICLYRNGQLLQLNREHDFKQKLILQAVNGEIPLQEVYADKRSGGLISFLGMGQLEYIDLPVEPLRLLPGDKLVLMTDGVYNALKDSEIITALALDEDAAPEALHRAIQKKAFQDQDNYTAVILTCKAGKPGKNRKGRQA